MRIIVCHVCIMMGEVGVGKDMGMAIHHAEEAAIRGHPVAARHNLGIEEEEAATLRGQ